MKIMLKNFLFSISIIFTVTTVSLAILYFIMPIYYEHIKLKEVSQEFTNLVADLEGKPLEEIKNKIDKQLFEGKEMVLLFLLDQNDNPIHPDVTINEETTNSWTEGQDETETINSFDVVTIGNSKTNSEKNIIHTIEDNRGEKYQLMGMYSLQPISDASEVLLQIYPFLLVIDFSIGGVAAYFYSRFSTKRIKQISLATNRMLSLDNTINCEIKGKDELAGLAQDINQLNQTLLTTIDALKAEVTKVEGIERSKADFMRVASHELKTPIASLMGIIDGMIYKVGKFKDHDRYLAICKDILQQQADMIQNVLTVSKLETFFWEETSKEIFSLKEVIEGELKTHLLLAEVNHVEVVVHLEECLIEGNRDELSKVVNNLLSNAFRYTKKNGQIDLILNQQTLIIENQAMKVLSEDELSQIFEPFYRPDFSRNRETGGSGLGLFIVKQILDKQGFAFSFKRLEDERMCFSIYFD